jgi:hypothetical protein
MVPFRKFHLKYGSFKLFTRFFAILRCASDEGESWFKAALLSQVHESSIRHQTSGYIVSTVVRVVLWVS